MYGRVSKRSKEPDCKSGGSPSEVRILSLPLFPSRQAVRHWPLKSDSAGSNPASEVVVKHWHVCHVLNNVSVTNQYSRIMKELSADAIQYIVPSSPETDGYVVFFCRIEQCVARLVHAQEVVSSNLTPAIGVESAKMRG